SRAVTSSISRGSNESLPLTCIHHLLMLFTTVFSFQFSVFSFQFSEFSVSDFFPTSVIDASNQKSGYLYIWKLKTILGALREL
ncbi:MAG: hypothetical protein J2P41_11120, partial [Blastocatellia bacterium]|nr:hypothetical protein [Blastocatellia bacterium]